MNAEVTDGLNARHDRRQQEIADERRRERSLRVGRLVVWLLPLEALAVLAATLGHNPRSPQPFGAAPWLVVALVVALVVGASALVRRRWPEDGTGRVGLLLCQFVLYLALIFGTEDHPDARSFEFASLALLSLFHDGVPMLLWVALVGATHVLLLGRQG
jgi:hypothetical protein